MRLVFWRKIHRTSKYLLETMPRILILLVLVAVLAPVSPAFGEPEEQSAATTRLLTLLTSGNDLAAISFAARQLDKGHSPACALTDDSKPPIQSSAGANVRTTAGYALENLGKYISLHPTEFPHGLPTLDGFKHPRGLGPLFHGMLPPRWESAKTATALAALDALVDDSWLKAAVDSGAFDFIHLIRARRGQLQNMLLTYQVAGDEVGVIRLGEAIGRYVKPARDIKAADLSTRTLALLLSGASGIHDLPPDQGPALAEIALGWRQAHPDLLPVLSDFRGGQATLVQFEVMDQWQRGERESAIKLLISRTRMDLRRISSFVLSLLLPAKCPDEEVATLARVIPTNVLTSCISQLMPDDHPADEPLRLAMVMMPELLSRGDLAENYRSPFSFPAARKTALREWRDGHPDRAYRMLQETFLNLSPLEHDADLLCFAAIAHALGKDTEAMEALDKRAARLGSPRLALHKAALLTVAEKPREAFDLARTQPPCNLLYQLLAECGEWETLREIAFRPSTDSTIPQWLCHVAFLNRPAAAVRAYFTALPEKTKQQTAPLLLLSGSEEMGRNQFRNLVTENLGDANLAFPTSLNAFDIREQAIASALDSGKTPLFETVGNYTTYLGMTRDKTQTRKLLSRLAKTATLPTRINYGVNPDFSALLSWQHKIRAAHGLIELGTVEQGRKILEELVKDDPEGTRLPSSVQNDFWAAFLPNRFTTHGLAEFLKIAELELPGSTKLQRHVLLAGILAGQAPPDACLQMLTLLEKHQAEIPLKDASLLVQKLSVALWEEPRADELRAKAERVFAFYQPDENQRAFFQRWARPAPWKDKFTFQIGIEEKPGNHHDPVAAGFRVLDGMGEIRRLLAANEAGPAEELFRNMRIRMLLDDLPDEHLQIITTSNKQRRSGGGVHAPEAIALIAANCWNLQASFLRDHALTTWRCGGMLRDPRDLVLSLKRNDCLREARIAALKLQHFSDLNNLSDLCLIAEIDGLNDAKEGRKDAALDRLGVCLSLSPYDPSPGMAILQIFKDRGDEGTLHRGATRIREHWARLVAEYPHSPQVREARHYWLGQLESFK